jgi:SAM-dependent methyltransferase
MNEQELFERQYGEKKIVYSPLRPYFGIRRFLKRYDLDRYSACIQFVTRGHRCLDIGCGDGYLLRRVAGNFEELYGLDISPSILEEARKKTREQLRTEFCKFKYIYGNVSDGLSFPDEFFDTIFSIATLQYVYDLFKLLREMRRVLKSGGEIIIQVPNIAYLFRRLSLLQGHLPVTSAALNWEEVGWDGGTIHYFNMKKLCWLFETNGFRIVAKTGSGFLSIIRNWWPSLLSSDLIIKANKV